MSLLVISACQHKDKNRITELIKEWDGKEILFPKEMKMVQVGDSIHRTLSLENYKIKGTIADKNVPQNTSNL